jgi:acyl-coenzyme A synthetase/AMP-(fatty) acid ligase
VIRISDDPIEHIDQIDELPSGEIGELIVSGPVVTSRYVTRQEANALHKIADGDAVWHRMGDVGYLDEQHRFWFCGRKAHRVMTENGAMYTVPCEAIVNGHQGVYRSALVGVGNPPNQTPVFVVETERKDLQAGELTRLKADLFCTMAKNRLTERVEHVLFHPQFPVDIRHNAKIFREELARWAAEQVRPCGRL